MENPFELEVCAVQVCVLLKIYFIPFDRNKDAIETFTKIHWPQVDFLFFFFFLQKQKP